jgi:hypothetical protein
LHTMAYLQVSWSALKIEQLFFIFLINSTKEAFGSKGDYRPNSSVHHPPVTVRSGTWLCATIVAALHSNNGRK